MTFLSPLDGARCSWAVQDRLGWQEARYHINRDRWIDGGSMWYHDPFTAPSPPPFFCKCLLDWSTTPPANSHIVDWDLDLVACVISPSLLSIISQSQLKLSLPTANERNAHFYLAQNPPANQQGAACGSNWSTFQKHSWLLPIAAMLCMRFCIYLDNAKLNVTCRIANYMQFTGEALVKLRG